MSSGHKRYHSHGAHPANEPSRTAKRCREPNPDGLSGQHEITPNKYTVGWVCALPLEMAAAKGMLDKVHPNPTEQDPSDHNTYLLGEVCGHNVVVACLPAGIYGITPAATVAKDMLRTFTSIRFGLMVGIGGGIPSQHHDVRLGDIVVAQPTANNGGVIQFDRGKWLQEWNFQHTGTLSPPPQVLLAALSRLQAEHLTADSRILEFLDDLPEKMKERFRHPGALNDRLYVASYCHEDNETNCQLHDSSFIVARVDRDNPGPAIHYGTIASGNQVVKDATLRDQLGQKLGALCFEMEAAGLQDFPSLVIRGICDYADSHKNKMWQFYAAAVAAAFAKELLSVIPPSRVLQEDPIPQLVSIASEQLDVSKQHLEVSSQQLREHQRMNRIIIDRAIDLHIIHEARYDSADVGSSPRCEENTRVRFQQTIEEWANAVDGEPFLWIVGPAGTGKSTLVRSIADSLHEAKKLIAGYFFKRGEQGRNDTNRLFPTLAMQLADNDRSFRTSLRASLRDNDKDSIDKKDLRFQFEKLLKGPLENLYPLDSSQGNKIIILDALDECESPENVPRILSLFLEICNKSTPLGLRLLLTSRPDPRIVDAFESLMQRGVAQQLQLHRIFSDDTKTDIRLYLENSFARVKRETRIQQDPWPTVEDLDRLVELSTNPEPLFIYASTLLRFIYDERRLQSPKNQLTIWLKQCQENKSQLHQIYNPILEQIFSLAKHTDFDQQLKFLGALVLVATPLSLQSLSSLLDLDVDDVNWWLPGLHAVLDIPSKPHLPIRLLHKSFGDFLLSKENPGHDHLRIDALEVHGLLANRCIELMTRCLKQDICDLRKLDATFEEIDDAKLNCHIPPELQYACLYWVYHLISSGNPTYEGILPFLHHHFLHWLEVLALIRRTSDGFKALRGLTDLIKNCSNSLTELVSFLKDATRTITSFATMIETVPLQTYASLLVFSPIESQVRQHFWDQRLPPRVHVEGNRSYWDAYVQTLHGRSGVKKLEFSPDGSFLAAVDHEVVHLMNASTGTYLTFFECPEEPECVVFSPTSQLLAVSESFGRALTIWSTSTWAQVQKIQCEGIVDTMAFSPDGASVIIASVTSLIGRVTFELWDARLGSLQRITSVTKSRYSWSGAAFSPSIQHFATTHTDNTIVLWNLEACTAQHTINTPNRPSVVAFSPDGNLFAAACGDVISMWDTATYTERCDFEILDPGIFKKLTFSPNGELLASVTSKHVAFWETNTGYYRDFEVGHASEVAFSSDSQYLATAKGATIRFWDMTEEYPQVDDEPSFPIEGRYFSCLLSSPKGKLVVSVKGGAVQIWDSFTGMLLRSLKHDMSTASHFQFSPDSKELSFQLSGLQSWKWNMEDGSQEPMLEGYCETLHRPVIFSANSQIAAVRRSDLIFNFYDTTTGRHVGSLEDCIYNFDAVTLSPDGDLLACWSNGCSIQVWDTKAGKCFLTIDNELHTFDLSMGERACKGVRKSPERSDRLLKFSPNGGILARHDFGGIKWWDIATGLQQATLEPEDGFFQEHAFSPNSLLLAARFSPFPHDLTEQVIQLYDAKTGEYQCTLHGHLGFAVHIVFSPNSLMVAVASDDRIVRLWHTATFIQLHAFQTYHDIPEITRFSDDGTFITVASGDKSIRLWDLTTGRLSQIIYHDEGFIEGLRVLHDQIAVSASNVEVWRWWDSWDTHNLKLLKYHYPLSVDSQPSITERFLSEFSLDADECWIMQGFEKVICIPLEYRPQKEVGDFAPQTRFWIKSGHTVFIACVNGQVVSFKCL